MRSKRPHHAHKTIFLLTAAGIVFLVGAVLLWAASIRLPDFDVFDERKVEQSTKIYDRTGEVLLFDLHENAQRTVVPFDQISRHVKNATVAIEDAEFYEHKGIKFRSILRAVLINLGSAGFSQGGSTITQQVVKNSLLTQEKTITRKIKEWILSLKLEQSRTKEEILALYLNEVPYGGSIYGVEEASRAFFGVSANDLSLAQSAYLAALPQAPTFYSPYGNNRERLDERKNLVLKKMLEHRFISEEEYASAKDTSVTFLPRPDTSLKAPHFVFWVREYLEQTYGQKALEERGFKVITTLDYDLQRSVEEVIRRGALENTEKFNATNAASVALDPKTGQVLALVGSRDYFDTQIDGNYDVTRALRQPGSSFKPFVYATAFKKGYTPETVLFDLPTQFSTECRPSDLSNEPPCYSPKNYDGLFRGPMSIRDALAQSVNVPAVQALYLAGLTDSLKTARDLGITTLTDPDRYGLTLVLGGGEVTLLEMVSAYGVFANEGVRNPTTPILRIEDNTGTVVEEFSPRPARVLDRNVALQISDILSDNTARTPAFGERSSLYFPGRSVAAKTGTTNDYRDAWVIGYTPSLVVGAWAGNNDNSPMEKKVAGLIIAPLWNEIMRQALSKLPEEGFSTPAGVSDDLKPILRGVWQGNKVELIDVKTKNLADEDTPPERLGERVTVDVHSILHWVNRTDPTGLVPTKPLADPQYRYWEEPVSAWATKNGYSTGSTIVIKRTDPLED